MIVAPRVLSEEAIKHKRIAVPGKLTTAYLVLNLFAPGIDTEVVPFDQIIPQVLEGKHEAGLIIHEGQLSYVKSGLSRIVDLGATGGTRKPACPYPLEAMPFAAAWGRSSCLKWAEH